MKTLLLTACLVLGLVGSVEAKERVITSFIDGCIELNPEEQYYRDCKTGKPTTLENEQYCLATMEQAMRAKEAMDDTDQMVSSPTTRRTVEMKEAQYRQYKKFEKLWAEAKTCWRHP